MWTIYHQDCIAMPFLDDNSVELVLTSPPYEGLRCYDGQPKMYGQDWVDWIVPRFREALRVCCGLVAFVVEGQVDNGEWSATPAMFITELKRIGVRYLKKPPVYMRYGTPGGGGKHWLKNNYELIVCASKTPQIRFADPLVCGHPPKYKPGGRTSHRNRSDARAGGYHVDVAMCNPGNVIDCGAVGGGNMGSDLATENEAPFSHKLADFFVRAFSTPNGIVLDPFSGSGTTAAAAIQHGRRSVSIDIRESQCNLTLRRIHEAINVPILKPRRKLP